jgi:hypothetical protein
MVGYLFKCYYYDITSKFRIFQISSGEKILASHEGAAEKKRGGIPPRPSVPPERSGGGQFRSKNVRVELYNPTKQKHSE